MTSTQNNIWVFSGITLFTLSACWRARGTLGLHQYLTVLKNSLTETPAKVIRKPTCMLPMLGLAHASNRAFALVSIMFCVGRLIQLSQTYTTSSPPMHRINGMEGVASFGELVKHMRSKRWKYMVQTCQPFSSSWAPQDGTSLDATSRQTT